MIALMKEMKGNKALKRKTHKSIVSLSMTFTQSLITSSRMLKCLRLMRKSRTVRIILFD